MARCRLNPMPHHVSLNFLDDERFFGFIVLGPGITYSTQAGGTLCAHPEAKGAYVPLPLSWLPDPDPLLDYWSSGTWEIEDVQRVCNFLLANEHLAKWFRVPDSLPLRGNYGEAWVPAQVVLSHDPTSTLYDLTDLVGAKGFLVYFNSD
jgi:hypothetical protein